MTARYADRRASPHDHVPRPRRDLAALVCGHARHRVASRGPGAGDVEAAGELAARHSRVEHDGDPDRARLRLTGTEAARDRVVQPTRGRLAVELHAELPVAAA